MRGAEEAVMHEEESLERHGSNGASASLAAGAAPLHAAAQRRRKPITRGRALGEILSELQQLHDERMQQYQELVQEHQALRTRQRVTSLWLAQMELLIEVTADLRCTCGKPGAPRTAGAEVAASAYASAAAAAAAEDPAGPQTSGSNKGTDVPADGAVREDFLARCLAKVRALRLDEEPEPHGERGRSGGSVGGSLAAMGSAGSSGGSGNAGGNIRVGTRKLRPRKSKEAAAPGTGTNPGPSNAGSEGSTPGTLCPVDAPSMPGWVQKLRRLETDEEQSNLLRLDTMQPYDTPPTVEHWAAVCGEMHLTGQQEAEVVELLAQWKPAVATSTAHRDALLATHAALLSAAPPASADELERLMAEVERANAEILFKAGAFTLALWAEILRPEQCVGGVIASYPYSSNLRSLDEGMRHLFETRDAPPPALLAPPPPPLSDQQLQQR